MNIDKAKLTPGKIIRAFWEKYACYTHDSKEQGGRRTMCVAQLDNHLIIGTRPQDFCGKWLSHDMGTHKYCLEIPKDLRETK